MTPETLADLHARGFTVPRPWTAKEFSSMLGAPGVFLTTCDNGFALARLIAGEVELLTITIAPEGRGLGKGRALLASFEAEARKRGAETSFLEVAADNSIARKLYAAAGYTEAGLRKSYYQAPRGVKIDALVLHKSLT